MDREAEGVLRGGRRQLKLWADGFACTCFGLIIRKG